MMGNVLQMADASKRRLPEWLQDIIPGTNGTPKAGIANAATILRKHPDWRGAFTHDEFAGEDLYHGRPATDADVTAIRELLERCPEAPLTIGPEAANSVVSLIASENRVHPVRDYLSSLVWDGTPRLASWLTTYLGVADSVLVRTIGTRWLISAVARIYHPGVKADHVLILEGPQGTGKSTALEILAGKAWFTDTELDIGSKDSFQNLRGCWLVELGEMASVSRAEQNRAKAFFSASSDKYRPSYGRRSVSVPRQCVFAGTVNPKGDGYLKDETGNRRFWPVMTTRIDNDKLVRDRDQLWAEALHWYAMGVPHWIDNKDVSKLASEAQADRATADVWTYDIETWLASDEARDLMSRQRGGIGARDILVRSALKKEPGEISPRDDSRVVSVLLGLNYEQLLPRPVVEGRKLRLYRPRQ